MWAFGRVRHVDRLNRLFRRGHGRHDAQETIGVILAVLTAGGHLNADAGVPLRVVLAAHSAIGLGTLSGGWRIVKTMGRRITRLQPVGGSRPSPWVFFTSHAGIPAIVGVGATRRLSAVRWGVAGRVVWAWVLTIPGALAIASIVQQVLAVVLLVAALVAACLTAPTPSAFRGVAIGPACPAGRPRLTQPQARPGVTRRRPPCRGARSSYRTWGTARTTGTPPRTGTRR